MKPEDIKEINAPSLLPPLDECTPPIHIHIPGECACLCGAVVTDEPLFPADFWDKFPSGPTTLRLEGKKPHASSRIGEAMTQYGIGYGTKVPEPVYDALCQGAATLDIVRYCKHCGSGSTMAHDGADHDFEPDIPWDWDGAPDNWDL